MCAQIFISDRKINTHMTYVRYIKYEFLRMKTAFGFHVSEYSIQKWGIAFSEVRMCCSTTGSHEFMWKVENSQAVSLFNGKFWKQSVNILFPAACSFIDLTAAKSVVTIYLTISQSHLFGKRCSTSGSSQWTLLTLLRSIWNCSNWICFALLQPFCIQIWRNTLTY